MSADEIRNSPVSNSAINRRAALKLGLAAAGAAAGGFVSVDADAQGRPTVNLQLGWLLSGNQLGEVVAKHKGFYEAEGINLAFQPGGPSIDGVAVVAAGRFEVGQVSSSPSLMLAASQDIPVRCFAVGAQQHPYCFFSLRRNPVREPRDLIGKKVGIQATGVILLRALLAKNNIPENQVQIVTIGAEMAPVMTGQVDVVTGWLTNTTALRVLGDQRVDLRLWDTGVRLYALPYYATVRTLQTRADALAKFVRATSKGWEYAHANRDEAVGYLIREFPNLNQADEREAADVMLQYAFNANTRTNGWGAMDPQIWREQIELYAQLGQFQRRTPALEEVMTMDILNQTGGGRARIG
ncbi:MAG: ABC transporter substrate-binding protein [Alphaproteobacteria bacterium]|nr:ABC transporter substrate-binding protein [Alphaproteobacteria bacterium]